jgi:hypothetical protein
MKIKLINGELTHDGKNFIESEEIENLEEYRGFYWITIDDKFVEDIGFNAH